MNSYAQDRYYYQDASNFAWQFESRSIPPSFDCNGANLAGDENVICNSPYGLPTFDNFFHRYMTFIMESIDDTDKNQITSIADKMFIERADCLNQGPFHPYGGILEECMYIAVGDGIYNLSNFLLTYENGKYKKYYDQIFGKLSAKEIDVLVNFHSQIELYAKFC